MGLSSVVPLAEAATFTFGCAVLHARWLDPKRVSLVLAWLAALLTAGVLFALTPEDLAPDPNALDPAGIWPVSGSAAGRSSEG